MRLPAGSLRVIFDFAQLCRRKPRSVSAGEARYAIVGHYLRAGGVLCWSTNRTDAEAGAVWYRKHGGDVRVVDATEALA